MSVFKDQALKIWKKNSRTFKDLQEPCGLQMVWILQFIFQKLLQWPLVVWWYRQWSLYCKYPEKCIS